MTRTNISPADHTLRRIPAWCLAMVALALVGCGGSSASPASPTSPAANSPAVPGAASNAKFPTSDASIASLIVPSISVNRPVITGTVDGTGRMVPPSTAHDVAYYEYSGRPGRGNAVFSGHVDYVGVGRAVFWDLQKVKEGDEVVITLADGLRLRYAVRFNMVYDASSGPWETLFGPQAVEDGITLYTCDGNFDPASGTYDKRRVVRAERIG